MKWKYFGAACVLVGCTLMRLGAPWYTVIAGIAVAIAWNAFNPRVNPGERRE